MGDGPGGQQDRAVAAPGGTLNRGSATRSTSLLRLWRVLVRSLAALIAVAAVVWCAAFAWAHAVALPSADTPSGLVRRYFTLVSAGREVEAARLRADEPAPPAWVAVLPILPSDEFALTNLRVDAGTRNVGDSPQPSFARGYRDVTYVGATFSQRWGDGETILPGAQFREVVVGRRDARSPWVILGVGTGG
jgi:hypothetical protein